MTQIIEFSILIFLYLGFFVFILSKFLKRIEVFEKEFKKRYPVEGKIILGDATIFGINMKMGFLSLWHNEVEKLSKMDDNLSRMRKHTFVFLGYVLISLFAGILVVALLFLLINYVQNLII